MIKKISDMTAADKEMFLKGVKKSMLRNYEIPWESIESRIIEEIENTFDDEKFARMDPEARIDAAYARKEFGNKKPELVDYLLWECQFVTKSEYVEI